MERLCKRKLQTEKRRLALDPLELNLNVNYASLFTNPLFSLLSWSSARDKKQKPRGIKFIDRQRKGVGVGEGENSSLFFLSRTPLSLSLALIARSPMFPKRTERKLRQHFVDSFAFTES